MQHVWTVFSSAYVLRITLLTFVFHPLTYLPVRRRAVKMECSFFEYIDGIFTTVCHHYLITSCSSTCRIHISTVVLHIILIFRVKYILLTVSQHISCQDSDMLEVARWCAVILLACRLHFRGVHTLSWWHVKQVIKKMLLLCIYRNNGTWFSALYGVLSTRVANVTENYFLTWLLTYCSAKLCQNVFKG